MFRILYYLQRLFRKVLLLRTNPENMKKKKENHYTSYTFSTSDIIFQLDRKINLYFCNKNITNLFTNLYSCKLLYVYNLIHLYNLPIVNPNK